MSAAFALVVALASPAAADAWPQLARAAAVVAELPDAPVLSFVRGGPHPQPLLDDELAASLEALRVAADALAPLDAALAAGRCVVPSDAQLLTHRALADWVLALAVADARTGKPKLAAISVGRAADLSATLGRCASPSKESQAAAVGIGSRARDVTFALADDGLLPLDAIGHLALALRPSTELATPPTANVELSGALDAARADQALLEEAGAALAAKQRSGAWPKNLPIDGGRLAHGERWFALTPVPRAAADIRCSAADAPDTFTMTREAAAALGRRGPDAILQDSLVAPQLDGSLGFIVARAGPVARSCGLVDGDVVLAVNDILLQRPEDALLAAPAQVQRDGRANFRVRRGGEERTIAIEPDRPTMAGVPLNR